MFSNSLVRESCKASDEMRMVLSAEDLKKVLEANAASHEDEHDVRGGTQWKPFFERIARRGINQAMDFSSSIELCCGNGFLYRTFNSGDVPLDSMSCHIDLSRSQLSRFRSGARKARLIESDVCAMPFSDECFDLVYGHSFIHHLPDVPGLLDEIRRVLRPGGRFIAFHEPTPTALFFESFPVSLYKRIDHRSLTDIWLLNPDVVHHLILESGFQSVTLSCSGISFSLLFTPWLIIANKLRLPVSQKIIARLKWFAHILDSMLPDRLNRRYAPAWRCLQPSDA